MPAPCSGLLTPSERPAIVLDCGSGYTKLGFAGNAEASRHQDGPACLCKSNLHGLSSGAVFSAAKHCHPDGGGNPATAHPPRVVGRPGLQHRRRGPRRSSFLKPAPPREAGRGECSVAARCALSSCTHWSSPLLAGGLVGRDGALLAAVLLPVRSPCLRLRPELACRYSGRTAAHDCVPRCNSLARQARACCWPWAAAATEAEGSPPGSLHACK